MKPADVARLFDVSRVTGYRWMLGTSRSGAPGAGVNTFLQAKVVKVSAQVEAALAAGALPNDDAMQLPPAKRATKLRSIINQHRVKK